MRAKNACAAADIGRLAGWLNDMRLAEKDFLLSGEKRDGELIAEVAEKIVKRTAELKSGATGEAATQLGDLAESVKSYAGAFKTVFEVRTQAQAIQEMIQKVSSSFEKLRDGGWIGTGADAFFGEMESLVFPATNRLQQALEEAGQATNKVAETVKRAEQEASALFRVR